MSTISYRRELPVCCEADVVVAGGGPAGIAAAVTAARLGARVFLMEQLSAFGGMGTSGGLPFFCRPTDGEHFLSAGFGREVYDRLWQDGGAGPDMVYGRHPEAIGGFIYNPETLKRIYDDLTREAGVEFRFNTFLTDVVTEGSTLTHVVCAAKSGVFAVAGKLFIDATGDGDLAAMAGAEFAKGDEDGRMQAGTLCSLWSGIDWSRVKIWADGARMAEAIAENMFTVPDISLPGILRVGSDFGWGNVGHVFGLDGTDEKSVTDALMDARRRVPEYEAYYRRFVPGCENARMLCTASLLGVRETRRISGDYVLDVEDFKRRAVFEDEIGRYAYPVDLHSPFPQKERSGDGLFEKLRYRNPGESYGIPYRSLLPRGLDNVLVVGRCVSTDRYMQGSLRVQPGCHITGQAAGAAAALAAGRNLTTRALPVADLQRQLIGLGAFLPNFDSRQDDVSRSVQEVR